MAGTRAFAGPGFLLQLSDGATPPNYATVANVGDISGPDINVDTHETTNQSSPDNAEEFIAGIIRTGEVAFPINWDPADVTHDATTGLVAVAKSRAKRDWRLILGTTGKRWAFSGLVNGFAPKEPYNGVLRADIKIKVSGGAPALEVSP